MDSAGKDIHQLCLSARSNTEINRRVREWLENVETDTMAGLCTCSCDVGNSLRTSLTCLLNSYYATEISVETFLNEQICNSERFNNKHESVDEDELRCSCYRRRNTSNFSLHDQELKGITLLHVAVYRNSLHADKIVRLLLNWHHSSNELLTLDKDSKQVSLASIPMTCGSYPLHILTGQNLTIKEELLETLLCADSSIPFKDDVNCDNPISLLWKNTLRFRWAISVMEGATFIDYIKNDDCSWMTIITPHQFIQFSLRMAEAALQKPDASQNKPQSSVRTIHDLCRIPRCPPMLLRLLQSPEYNAVFAVSGSASTFDQHGMLPIHHAVRSPPVTYRFLPSSLKPQYKKSLVEMLLEENPASVRIADDQGRLPLHYALESGFVSERDLMALIRLYPESLRIKDPQNGLLPFMMVSADHERTAKCNSRHDLVHENEQKLSSSMYENSDKGYCARKYRAEWKRDHVKMTYLLLMLCPDAISWTNSTATKKISRIVVDEKEAKVDVNY